MANSDGSINTQYMFLPNPVPSVTPGTAYASDIYNCLTIIDAHNHTSGSGQLVPVAGLNINGDLPLNGNNLTLARAVRFSPQSAPISDTSPDQSELYVATVSGQNELFYNGTTGTPLQITSSGSLNVTSSGISNAPASATLISGALVVKSTASLAGNIDGGAVLFRNTSPNSTYAVTVQPVSSLSSNYVLTLPNVPAQTNVMTLSSSGNMGSVTYDQVGQNMSSVGANAIAASVTRSTGTSVGIGGVAISNSCGNYSSTGSQPVTNLSVTITTSGRPVFVGLIPDGTNSFPSSYVATDTAGPDGIGQLIIERNSSDIGTSFVQTPVPVGSITVVDPVGAGTYTYLLRSVSFGSYNVLVQYAKLVAYEL